MAKLFSRGAVVDQEHVPGGGIDRDALDVLEAQRLKRQLAQQLAFDGEHQDLLTPTVPDVEALAVRDRGRDVRAVPRLPCEPWLLCRTADAVGNLLRSNQGR